MYLGCTLHYLKNIFFSIPENFLCVCICSPDFIELTRVMMYPIGEDSLCRRLPICLGGWHASKTIYTNRGGDASYCRGADAWRSTATCIQGADTQKQRETVRIPLYFFPRDYGDVLL